MENTIIFKIEIKKENGGFPQASNFISKLCEGRRLVHKEVSGITSIRYESGDMSSRRIAGYVVQHLNGFKPVGRPENLDAAKNYNICYCLWVEEASLEDIIDLQYDCLIKKFFAKERIVTVLSGRREIYHKASHYLYDISCHQESLYNNFFYREAKDGTAADNKLIRLQKNNVKNLMDFMPLQYFSREEKSFLDDVETVITKSVVQQALMGKSIGEDAFSPVIGTGLKLLNSAGMQEEMAEQISGILCKGNVFTFLLFAYSFSYKAFWRQSTSELVEQCYFTIKECAAGCEQLIENVVGHSTAHFGGLTIRMHEGDSLYLQNRYGLEKSHGRYVELLITDYAGINTYGNMADNFRYTMSENDRMELDGLEPVDFLVDVEEQNEQRARAKAALKEYNGNSENIGKHIGLKIFRKVVEENDGIFGFYSHATHQAGGGENYRFAEYSQEFCMPGTGYTVLFPVKKREKAIHRAEIGIDYNIDLEKNIKEYSDGYDCEEKTLDGGKLKFKDQGQKEAMIAELALDFEDERYSADKKRRIKYISADNLADKCAEYIAKALVIASYEKRVPDYVFYNCRGEFVSIFQQTMSAFFEMPDLEYIYENSEFVIALYTKEPVECCFIIPGHYEKTLWANRTNCYLGSEYMGIGWLAPYKEQYRNRKPVEGGVPPYDILHKVGKDGKEGTIFEKYALQILETDIQESKFGCKINDTHMRLGSTIHIDNFYEAELLFSNRLFFSRFAYLLSKDIGKSEQFSQAKQITLYSYALYSEMLIVETVNILSILFPDKDIDYAILERESDHRDFSHIDRIRYSRSFASDEQGWEEEEGEERADKRKNLEKEARAHYFQGRKVICIVPINSTLKTHEKLLSLFCEDNGEACTGNIILNYALVLVGSQKGNTYWEINETDKTFNKVYLDIYPVPHYFLAVKVAYYEAIHCELCFPDNPLDEIPLVEVNAASTIPNQSFGLYGEGAEYKLTYETIAAEEEELSVLRESLVYSHTQRGENHFLYYFKTDELFLRQKQDIESWLREKAGSIHISADEYHVLFCPSHYSNAGFLACVNRIVFHEAALVIRVDMDKEYRSNLCTKYSNLTALAGLLEHDGNRTVKIYYVDDSIVSGRTYFRARSLVSSVLERYKKDRKRSDIHIFEKIFVLLDRNSVQSRLQYIGCWDSKNKSEELLEDSFFAYRTLRISSMRNHGDSCILCRLEREAKLLYRSSATRQMAIYWRNQDKKFKVKHLRDKQEESRIARTSEKAFRRMFCCHMATKVLAGEKHGNRKENAVKWLLKLLYIDYMGRREACDQETAFEYFMSYLKIISRPFLVFDKAVKEAVFDVQLVIAEGLLGEKAVETILRESKKKYLAGFRSSFGIVLDEMVRKGFSRKQKLDLLKLLLKQLTEMKSNYFIRIENIRKLSAFAADYEEEDREKLYQRFLQQTKRLLGVSSDTSKSAWFSHQIREKENTLGLPEHILGRLLLENTRAYYDGLEKLCRKMPDLVLEEELRKTAYRDFVSVLGDIGLYDSQNNCITKEGRNEVKAAAELLHQCQGYAQTRRHELSEKKIEGICCEIVKQMKTVLGAERVELLLEYPMECDKWEDTLTNVYNGLAERYVDNAEELKLQLQNRREYLAIADSEKAVAIEGAEISVAEKMQKYHSVRDVQKISGLYIGDTDDSTRKYIIWEIGYGGPQWEEQRRLLIYAEFAKMDFPEMWHKLRNLLSMSNSLNESVFNEEVIDYLFELILADKNSVLSEKEKTHSHTGSSVRSAFYSRVCVSDNERSSEYRSYALTLLSDLQVSQVYRKSLKEDYYCNQVRICRERRSKEVFAAFEDGMPLTVVDRNNTSKCISLYVKRSRDTGFLEDEVPLSADDMLLSFAVANGRVDVFQLLFSLVMNAAETGRGVREKADEGEEEKVNVYLTKTRDGYLRISNSFLKLEREPEQINAEQFYPPRRERGISLWSVSRYIRSMVSSMLKARIEEAEKVLEQLEQEEKRQKILEELKTVVEKGVGREYYIRVSTKRGNSEEEQYFCTDIPILAEKYKDL